MLDYTKKKKKKFEVIMYDGTLIKIPMPKKKIFDTLVAVENDAGTDALYEAVTMIVNSNGKKEYKSEEIEEMFDYDDIDEFMSQYIDFVKGKVNDPN